MGREATCQCRWADEEGECKVLLESGEMVVRGSIRRRAPLSSLSELVVDSEYLLFRSGRDHISLKLGAEMAQKWLKAIETPPPTLAKKLGISSSTRVLLLGQTTCKELEQALEEAGAVDEKDATLILACVYTEAELHAIMARCIATCGAPLWIIYPKGANNQINETVVRDTLRRRSFIDVKVASVSAKLTAMRFVAAS